jgi:hypothetical protein
MNRMNTLTSKIISLAFLLGFSHSLMAHVVLDYPQGGETFNPGQVVTIQWHISIPHDTQNWDIYFSSNGGGDWTPLELNLPVGSLSFQWTVQEITTTQARIRVVQDNGTMDYQDDSGNFTIEPSSLPPSLDQPASNMTIQCNPANQQSAIQAWLNNNGGAMVTNYCADLNWTNNYNGLSNGCGATGNATVTFTATDACGSTMTTAILTVADEEAPVLSLPAMDMVVQCNGSGNVVALNNWLNSRGGASASDVCSGVTWTNNFSGLSNGCGATGSASVIFTATDECGNGTTTNASFTIMDNVAPNLITGAHDTTIQCGSNQALIIQNWLSNHGGASANDNCGSVSWTNNYTSLSNGCGATGSATVIFTVTDECGNSKTANATFAVTDNIAPAIIAPAHDTTIQCGSPNQTDIIQNWLNSHAGANANDNCGNVTWANNFTGLSDGCGLTGNATVTFTVTDECGNSKTTNAIFTVADNVAPTINVAAKDTTIACGLANQATIIQHWLNNHGGATASDNCGNVSWTNNFPTVSDTCSNTLTLDITFTATDECSNNITTHANFTILGESATGDLNYTDVDFKIYPNPASDNFTVVIVDDELFLPVHLTIFDLYGVRRWNQEYNQKEISVDVKQFAHGIYFLKVETAKGAGSRKVIIQ